MFRVFIRHGDLWIRYQYMAVRARSSNGHLDRTVTDALVGRRRKVLYSFDKRSKALRYLTAEEKNPLIHAEDPAYQCLNYAQLIRRC